MIFVLLGTQDSPFPRILEEMEQAILALNLTEKVYAQTGTTKFASSQMILKDYVTEEEYHSLMKEASLIITHGGAGTIFHAMHLGKKIICLPRRVEFGEHNDNHQQELVEKLSSLGYIYEAKNSLTEAIKEMASFTPLPYVSNHSILTEVAHFIENE